MLHEMEEMDRRDEGILTRVKRDSIISYVKLGDEFADPEFLAKNFSVSIEDVQRVIREMKG